MNNRDFILGLSISGGGIQAVELERTSSTTTLLSIDEWENTFPRGATNGASGGMQEFQRHFTQFMRDNQVRAQKVSVAIDTSMLFLNCVPIEQGLTRAEINDHMKWELTLYHPEASASEFITDVHILAERSNDRYSEALSVSVNRHDASRIQKAVSAAGRELYIVDADHFAADTALRINYPDTYRKYIALVGIKEDRLDISLMRNGSLESYRYLVVKSNQEIIQGIAALARKSPGIYSITVYGPYLDRDLLTQIRRGSPILVEALNPLRHINVSDSLRLADHLTVPSYRFAAAVGVALRKD
ncbi:MAG TPA: pilus assembly protein PilM [Bacteroidota bacterium]|nr:pilus assembly protein PilM [Bacteroidota bacterium]